MIDFGTLLQGFGGGMRAVSAYTSAKNEQAALTAQAQVARNNALLSEWQADDAEMRGEQAANNVRLKGNQVKGAQRAAMAANGVDLSVGSAQRTLNDTDYLTALDAAQLQDNAAREAWGYRRQGANYTSQAQAADAASSQISPWLAAGTSLLSSATAVAGRWYQQNGAAALVDKSPAAQARDARVLEDFQNERSLSWR